MKKINMKSKSIFPSLLTIATIGVTAGLIACHSPKQRPDILSNESKELIPITEINNKRFAVKTLSPVEAKPVIAEKAAATGEGKKVAAPMLNPDNSLPVVEIETSATLLNNVPFKAVPNSSYEAMYRLEGKNINVYKVGGDAQMDADEAKSGILLADARLAVPLVSYSVTFIKLAKKLNDDKEPTKLVEETVVEDETLATHVRIDKSTAKISSAITKSKIIPANFFEGQWMYKFTILGDKTSAAVPALEDMGLAEKVELKMTEEGVQVVWAVEKADAAIAQEANSNVLLLIPGTRKDFEQAVATNGKKAMLSGKMTTAKSWSQKRFIKLQPELTKTVMSNEYLAGSFLGTESKILNFVITDNAISFDLEPQDGGMNTRFTLVRVVTPVDEKAKTAAR